jgi:4-amino-4-deoxy-L-arabinose transferase-like glycosyltransferase
MFDQRTALIAAAIAAVYPEAIALGAFVLSEAPFTPLMMLNLICWTLAWRGSRTSSRAGWSLAAGVAAGLATLMRPSWLLFLPFATVIGFIAFSGRRKQAIIAAVMLAGLALTMLPWWIRNYRIAGRFVPTTLQVGASLYDGLSPHATGASDMRFVGQFVTEQREADAQPGADTAGLFEDRLDRRLRTAAIEWARQHPQRVLELAIKKFARMWSFVPNASEFQSRPLRLVLALTYTPVIVLALMGMWRYSRRDWPYLLCVLPAVYFTCLHIVFVSSIRYRQPAILPLIVLVAAVLNEWIQSSRFKVQG